MSKFIKKPVVIEARRLSAANLAELEAWCGGSIKGVLLMPSERIIHIQTLEGEMTANIGDWIIKEPFPTGDRQFYPCKPDIFEATYDPA